MDEGQYCTAGKISHVDLLPIASKESRQHLANVHRLQEYQFGMSKGLLSSSRNRFEDRGIRANPMKTKTVADMQSPKTLKGIQSNSGKFAAFNQKGLPRDEEVDHRVAILDHPKARRDLVHLPRGLPRRYFLTEIPVAYKGTNAEVCNFADEETKPEEWTMYTDGASSTKGVGARLVLIDPSRAEYTYTLRLNFTSSNNEAEYEALLAGLRIAQKMKVQVLKAKVDSKLAADVLSKLASVAFNHLTKEILVEVLNSRSTDVEEVNDIVDEEGDQGRTWLIARVGCAWFGDMEMRE
ncbi:reverse transcriptase domain-containing protein [Tanacetum coccineum]